MPTAHPTTVYTCDICSHIYDSETKACACESGHKEIKEIQKSYHANSNFPWELRVTFVDGNIRKYQVC